VSVYPLLSNFEFLNQCLFTKLGMYNMTPEPISTEYFINRSHQSLSPLSLLGNGLVNMIPSYVAWQRFDKQYPATTNTRNNRRIVGSVVSYAVRVVSKESMRLVLPRTSCLLFHSQHVWAQIGHHQMIHEECTNDDGIYIKLRS
jgi:hypothetical protein